MLADTAADLDRLAHTLRNFEANKALTKSEASLLATHLATMCREMEDYFRGIHQLAVEINGHHQAELRRRELGIN